MPIDYSKWDKIELSDDSDVEVHPNVDKNSFIRWKQRDIHEKRQQRNIEIKSILVQLTMYAKLNTRVDYLLSHNEPSSLLNGNIAELLKPEFNDKEKFDYEKLKEEKGDELRKGLRDLSFDKEEIENTPPYNEMVEDLFIQVKEDHPDAATDANKLIQYIKDHRAKIDDILLKQTIKLDELLHQKSMLISSDDYHTGFDRSFLNKDAEEDSKKTEKATTMETIHTPSKLTSSESNNNESKDVDEMFDELKVLPETAEFGRIPKNDHEQSARFLARHPFICTEHQKDSLIMTAFDLQLGGKEDETAQIVHQSLLLQYVSQLVGNKYNKEQTIKAISLFFSKINDESLPAAVAFKQDVANTVNHIKTRCEVIKKEREEQGEEEEVPLIQLRALDDSTELSVNTPQEGTKEYEIFLTKLSKEMQDAIKSGNLDEVNRVFASMKIEDAEEVLEVFNECNVIGVNGVLENEDDFNKLKEQYEENLAEEEEVTPVMDDVD